MCSQKTPDVSYHGAVSCSIDWESIAQLTLNVERGMRCCEDNLPSLLLRYELAPEEAPFPR